MVRSSRANWMNVATVEKAAPATAALMLAGSLAARPAIAPIVAVLETKPDARPAMGSPKRAPSARVATSACPERHHKDDQEPDAVRVQRLERPQISIRKL